MPRTGSVRDNLVLRALRRARRAVPVSAGVGVVLVAATVVVALMGQSATGHRNTALLRSETTQGAAVVTSSLNDASSAIDALADTVTVTNGSTAAFTAQAQGLVQGPMSAAFAKGYLTRYGVAAAVGNAFRTGQVLDPSLVSAIPRGSTTSPGVAAILAHDGIATFAAAPPFVPASDVVVVQVDVGQVLAAMTSAQGAFAGAQLTLYASSTPEPAAALVSTGPTGTATALTASAVVTAGADAWLLVVRAPSPLFGPFAAATPLIVLVLGLVVAVLAAAVIEMASRRRRARRAGHYMPVAPPHYEPTQYERADYERAEYESYESESYETESYERAEYERAEYEPGEYEPAKYPAPYEPASPPEPPPPHYVDLVPPATAPLPPHAVPLPTPPLEPLHRPMALVGDDHDAGDEAPVFQNAEWRPDPSGRYELRRYVDGQPTSLVRSGDAEQYDDVSSVISRTAATRPAVHPPVAGYATSPDPSAAGDPRRPGDPAPYDATAAALDMTQDADAVIDTLVDRVTESIASELKERGDDTTELPWAVGDDSY